MSESNHISRRKFIGLMGLAALAVQIPFTACKKVIKPKAFEWEAEEMNTLNHLLQHLWPNTEDVPTLVEMNTLEHLTRVLKDPYFKPSTRKILRAGPRWIEEEAQMSFQMPFPFLNQEETEEVLRNLEDKNNGSTFLTHILNFLHESLLGDPEYQINKDKKGWLWLGHYPGNPRPTESQIYTHYGKEI